MIILVIWLTKISKNLPETNLCSFSFWSWFWIYYQVSSQECCLWAKLAKYRPKLRTFIRLCADCNSCGNKIHSLLMRSYDTKYIKRYAVSRATAYLHIQSSDSTRHFHSTFVLCIQTCESNFYITFSEFNDVLKKRCFEELSSWIFLWGRNSIPLKPLRIMNRRASRKIMWEIEFWNSSIYLRHNRDFTKF